MGDGVSASTSEQPKPVGQPALPLALTSFIGRDEERATVERLLAISRLVTLTGPPGVGKTRLALETASRLSASFGDGARLVELAPLLDPTRVAAAVATGLAIPALPRRSLLESLIIHLRSRNLLLVLDNCEHLVDETAELAKALLEACPNLTMLATSREPLAIPGEATWRVRPLPVPGLGQDADPTALAKNPSVRLFVDRASAMDPRFALTALLGAPVAEICRRLDGLPLALELAAARVDILAPAEIAANLDERLRLLPAASRGYDPRHRSLRACIDWSHELLGPAERALLRRLSVFAGGCTLAAAEAVCSGSDLEPDEVLEPLAQLVSKSLVTSDTSLSETRYGLFEAIREYGVERLAEAGEAESTMSAHLLWCERLAEEAEPELIGGHQGQWMERIDEELPNLRAALNWALGTGQADRALRVITPLILYGHIRGYFLQVRRWLEEALDSAPKIDLHLRARAEWGIAFMALYLGDLGEARPLTEKAVETARASGDAKLIGRALSLLADLQMLAEPAASWPTLEEASKYARQADDAWCLADTLGKWGWAHLYHGDPEPGRGRFAECLELARERDDRRNMRRGYGGLGWAALLMGDLPEAERQLAETLSLARELGDSIWTAQTLNVLGELRRATGDYEAARELSSEALELGREIDAAFAISNALGVLGRIALSAGDREGAAASLDEAIELARRTGLKNFQAWWLQARGEVAEQRGELADAERLYAEAGSIADELGNRRDGGRSLTLIARVARTQGDHHRARDLLHTGLAQQLDVGDAAGVTETLEELAALVAEEGRAELAARLLGASSVQRERVGQARTEIEATRHEQTLATIRGTLSDPDFARAQGEGMELELAEAAALASRMRGKRFRPGSGWASLTPAERDVAALASEGLTNREIAERLFVSPSTVKTHLEHVYRKLEVGSRKELAGLAPSGASEPLGPRPT